MEMGFLWIFLTTIFVVATLFSPIIITEIAPSLTKKRPTFFFKAIRFLIRKKWFKITKDYSGYTATFPLFLFEKAKIEMVELSYSIKFRVRAGFEDIITFKVDKETKKITEFSCSDNMKTKGKETLLLETIQDVISFGCLHMLKTQIKEEELLNFFQNQQVKETKKEETNESHPIPSALKYPYYQLQQLSTQLLKNKALLDTEQVYFIESTMEKRIPSIFELFDELSGEQQNNLEKSTKETLQKALSQFQVYEKQIEESKAFDLKKQLRFVNETIKE